MKTTDLEKTIFALEKVRVVIRADKNTDFPEYVWVNKADENSSVNDLKKNRLKPTFGNHETVIVSGSGDIAHGGTSLKKIRASYGQE